MINCLLLQVPSFEVQVGLHELLGHGSGKLLYTGKFPDSLANPLTKEAVAHSYGPGETYDSVFTSLGSSYEECRAECVGIHLCLEPGVTEIFGHSGAEAKDIKYVNWLSMAHAGLKGLEMFSPASGEWKQAHSQARFVIMQVMLEAGEDFLTIKECVGEDGKPDMLLTMDRVKIPSVGQPAIASFLQKLQIYKATADIKAAKEMYDKYSEVSEPWASRRDIVVDRKQPRMILVQGAPRRVIPTRSRDGTVRRGVPGRRAEGGLKLSTLHSYLQLGVPVDGETVQAPCCSNSSRTVSFPSAPPCTASGQAGLHLAGTIWPGPSGPGHLAGTSRLELPSWVVPDCGL